jgi:hypothetical protein
MFPSREEANPKTETVRKEPSCEIGQILVE